MGIDPDLGVSGFDVENIFFLQGNLLIDREEGNWTIRRILLVQPLYQLIMPIRTPDVGSYIIWGAVPIGLIPAAYGLLVYIISLIIRIIRKPKM